MIYPNSSHLATVGQIMWKLAMSLPAGALVLLFGACGEGGEGPQPEWAEIAMVEIINQVEPDRPQEDDKRHNFLSAQVGENLIPAEFHCRARRQSSF